MVYIAFSPKCKKKVDQSKKVKLATTRNCPSPQTSCLTMTKHTSDVTDANTS